MKKKYIIICWPTTTLNPSELLYFHYIYVLPIYIVQLSVNRPYKDSVDFMFQISNLFSVA
jgi:hypothetical protein